MDRDSFKELRDIIYSTSGISLSEGKQTLVSTRIYKRLKELNLDNEKQYLRYLKDKGGEQEIVLLLDVITTNVTHFFREMEHFNVLETLLHQWHDEEKQRKFRIWSAASSSGEEPYSIIMTAAKTLNLNQVDLRVLGTDISTKVLDKALAARYPNSALQSIPPQFQNDSFIEGAIRTGNEFAINPRLVKQVDFARMNLSVVPYPMKGPFDIIFCRNVMIYFEDAVRQKLVTEFERLLRPNGYLFIGHSESLIGLNSSLITVKPSIFRKA